MILRPVGTKRLYTTTRVFEQSLGDDWVLFAPDHVGLPIVVDSFTHELLRQFVKGAVPESVIADYAKREHSDSSVEEVTALVGLLSERGFLRDAPTTVQYKATSTASEKLRSLPVWMHVTNECNLDCSYCFVDKSAETMSSSVASTAVKQIARTATTRGSREVVLKFAGGEPTLVLPLVEAVHDELKELLDKVGVRLVTAIISNGTCLNQRLIDFLHRPNVTLGVSLDGYASSHDIHRVFKHSRAGSWDLITRNVQRLQAAGIRPRILTIVSQDTSESLPQLMQWIFQNDLTTRINVVRESGWMKDVSGRFRTDYGSYVDRLNSAFERAFSLLENQDYCVDLLHGLEIAGFHVNIPEYGTRCSAGRGYVVFNEMGELARCPMLVHRETAPATDDLLQTVSCAFSYPSFDRHGEDEVRCLSCQWFPVCVSGCPVHNESFKGSPFATSPLCGYYSYVIPRYVVFFGRKLVQAAHREGLRRFRVLTHTTSQDHQSR